MKKKFNIFVLGLFAIALMSCGSSKELTAAMNNDDPETGPRERLALADEYYEKADFYKAIQLYEVVINERIMIDELDEVYFKFANCHFAQADYTTASDLFNYFYLSYPDNENAETAYFFKAQCTYELAENDFRLDASNLLAAMNEFADYLTVYPDGEYADQSRDLMEQIKLTKEQKELENGKLYLKIGEYKAAISEFNSFIEDNPTSDLVEIAYVRMLEAQHLLAKNSYANKQQERYEAVFTEFGYFVDKYPNSVYSSEMKAINDQALKEYNKLYKNEQANNQ